MENIEKLSPAAKKVICILLDEMTLGQLRLLVGEGFLSVAAELEDLQKQLEIDILQSGMSIKRIDKMNRPATTKIS